MITAANCDLLWAFAWIQSVVNLSAFSCRGENLWLHDCGEAPRPDPAGVVPMFVATPFRYRHKCGDRCDAVGAPLLESGYW